MKNLQERFESIKFNEWDTLLGKLGEKEFGKLDEEKAVELVEKMREDNLETVSQFIESHKGFFAYRIDARKMNIERVNLSVELIKKGFDDQNFDVANKMVNKVLTEKSTIRMFFDAVAIQNEDLCKEGYK